MWILFLIAFFLIPLLPTLILYLWKLRKHKNSGVMLLSIYALQAVLMLPIGVAMNSNLRVAAAGLGAMGFFMGINFIVNILLCPVLYFLCINPNPQRRKKTIISVLLVFVGLLLWLFSDQILTRYNFKNNISLYGKVENPDGSPIKNATIHFRNMRDIHFKENPITTNEKGIFNVQGRSQGYSFLQMNKIYDTQAGSDCKQIIRPSFYSIGNEHTMANMLNGTSENNPMIVLCWYEIPDNTKKRYSGFVFDLNSAQQKHHLVFYSDEACIRSPKYSRRNLTKAQYIKIMSDKTMLLDCFLNLDIAYHSQSQSIVITSNKKNMQKYDINSPYRSVLKQAFRNTVEYKIPDDYFNQDEQPYLIFKSKGHYTAVTLKLIKWKNNTVRGNFRAIGFYKFGDGWAKYKNRE